MVSEAQLKKLYETSDNSIFLAMPRTHQEAISKLESWKQEKTLQQDVLPAIYPYYLKFSLFGSSEVFERKGFIAMVKMHKEGENPSILLHENTLKHSVADRVELLKDLLLNVAPTHALYDDPNHEIEPILDEFSQKPIYHTIDYQGVLNQFSIIQNKEAIQKIQKIISNQALILADGHHRLESSKVIRDKFYKENPNADPDHILNYHMMFLSNLRGKDLRILPTHRFVSKLKISAADFIVKALKYFEISESDNRIHIQEEIKNKKYHFGLVTEDNQYILKLKPRLNTATGIDLKLVEPVKQLDYTVLHYYIFDKILGIPYNEQSSAPNIQYVKDFGTLHQKVCETEKSLGFVVNEVSIEEMLAVCATGEKMPQKSTYFYPKVLCGMVFGSVKEDENQSRFGEVF